MAITNICGFESGGANDDGGVLGGEATIQATTKRTGDYALKCLPVTTGTARFSNFWIRHGANGDADTTGYTTAYARFYIYIAALPSAAEDIFYFNSDGGGGKLFIRIDSAGRLTALDSALASLGTGTTVLSLSTWYRIEAKAASGASAAWEVKINGTSELSGSTANLLTNFNNALIIGKQINRNGSGYEIYFDDVAVSDTDYPGPGAVACIRPDGDGNYTAWTGTYTAVDDLTSQAGNDGDTTIWSSSTNLAAETAALESCSSRGISGTINAVKTMTVVRKAVGTALSLQHRLRVTSPGTADTDLTSYAATESYVLLASVRVVNPSGGAAWNVAGVDSLEVGVEHNQSQSRQANCTMVCAMVDYTAADTVLPPTARIFNSAVSRAANW